MSTQIYTQTELKSIIIPILHRYHANQALLFGSYARNEATASSDIDLIVIGNPDFNMLDIFAIAEEIYESTGKKVDVYEISEIDRNAPIYLAAMSEGVCFIGN